MIDLNESYDGGKGVVFRNIINEMPPHKTYVEAFVGRGAVAMNKKPAERNILIDKDSEVIEAWQALLVENGGTAASPDVTRAAPIAGRDDAAPSSKATIPAENSGFLASSDDDCPGYLVTFDDGTRWELYVGDAVQLLPLLGLGSGALVYADPPYLYDVRLQKRPLYKFEMGERVEHQAMLQMLRKLDCKVMLSGYWSELYDRWLADWRTFRFDAYDRGGNCKQEIVWCNFPVSTKLHDYQWLGDNFRERERIGRKAARWVNRFESLPVLERRRILAELDAAGVLD